jgi:predicted phosphodiesterase
MKLLVLSDLHLEVGSFRVPDVEVDVVILAGDIATPGSKVPSWARRATNFGESTPIVFIPGNHEFYGRSMSSTLVDLKRASVGTNFHALDGAEVVLGGVRFLGCTLWTDFALNIDTPTGPRSDIARSSSEAGQVLSDFHVIGVVDTIDAGTRSGARRDRRRIFTPEDSMALHRQHRAWLSEKLKEPFNGPTVVVTHHSPHRGSLAARFAADWVSGAFVSELPLDFFEVPVLWIHGHTHTSFDYRVGQCRVVCNPRGYVSRGMLPENEEFNPSLVVELTP